MEVPKGQITTYGELARAVGLEGGQRAIGRIMSQNPYPGIVPCHRVVMSTGDVGGYAYGGKDVKINMLHGEGLYIKNNKVANLKDVMHHF